MVARDLLAEVRGPPNLLDEHDHCLAEVLRVFDPNLAALDCLTGLVRGSDPAFARALADVVIGRAERVLRALRKRPFGERSVSGVDCAR